MDKKTALLIIDVQVNMFDEAMPVHGANDLLSNLRSLCELANIAGVPIIFIRYDGGDGAPDEFNSPGWQLHPSLVPFATGIIVDKRFDDSFRDTGLQDQLGQMGIERLVIAGLQSEYCINSTTRRAAELGYDVTLVSDVHSTFDGEGKTATEIINEHNQALANMVRISRLDEVHF